MRASMKEWLKEQRGLLSFKMISGGNFPRRIEWPVLLKWLDPVQGERVLDVACGRGGLTLRISASGCDTVGMDLSAESMKWAALQARRMRYDCSFVAGDAHQLPFPDACFDKVVCSSALEHFQEDGKALTEMHRVLKPDGKLILTVDSFTYPFDDAWKARHKETFYVVNYYDENKLYAQLTEAGFDVTMSKYLMHSRTASFFFKTAIASYRSLFLSIANVLIAYPLIVVAERLSRNEDVGFSLIAEGKKLPVIV
jgi:ubiquinone/menaquinone biosynthesis C-methylase UbiE